MSALKIVLAAATISGGLLAATAASAMPVAPLPSDQIANVDQVRWVCNPWGRCWWRPNVYYGGYGFYGPRRFYGGYGYRRGYGRRW
jgi:hypothetical protein